MNKYDDHSGVLGLIKEAQSAESDRRDLVREVHVFLNEPDGQWEDDVSDQFLGRPRYTLDKCNDIVDDIAGEMEQADFNISVKPAGGDATKDLAKTYDGLIRNIENLSGATDIFNAAGRSMVAAGFDCWRVSQRWGDNNSFDQDLYIDPISDAVDKVWFDPGAILPTREDGHWVFVLQAMIKHKYDEQFPDGSGMSISEATYDYQGGSGNYKKPDVVVVGEFLYKEKITTRIVEMNNGSVYVDDDKYQSIKDELALQGIVESRSRDREMDTIKSRLLDGGGWLTDVQDTVFDMLPIIPAYGNWRVSQSTPIYWGIISKKMDAQRIYNYSESRKVEEGALAPLAKILATSTQIGPHKTQWEDLNTSSDPVLMWMPDAEAPPPFKIGGPEINPGLESTSASAESNLQSTAGIDQLNGQPLGLQSGVAVELKQNKGDTRNHKYTAALQRAICHTGKVLMRAIPKVYDTKRLVRVIGEDGVSFEMTTLNESVIDEETKQLVTLNDLSRGLYDVTCDVGPAFKNRQSETSNAFAEIAAIDPSIIQEGKDIWYGNLNAPGMDLLAERARQNMLLAGGIPESQMTDDEKELLANQPEAEPDPVAEALQREADNADDQVQLKGIEQARKDRELDHKIAKETNEANIASMTAATDQIKAMADELNTQAQTLKLIREGMGIESITGPQGLQAFIDQAAVVADSQAEQS